MKLHLPTALKAALLRCFTRVQQTAFTLKKAFSLAAFAVLSFTSLAQASTIIVNNDDEATYNFDANVETIIVGNDATLTMMGGLYSSDDVTIKEDGTIDVRNENENYLRIDGDLIMHDDAEFKSAENLEIKGTLKTTENANVYFSNPFTAGSIDVAKGSELNVTANSAIQNITLEEGSILITANPEGTNITGSISSEGGTLTVGIKSSATLSASIDGELNLALKASSNLDATGEDIELNKLTLGNGANYASDSLNIAGSLATEDNAAGTTIADATITTSKSNTIAANDLDLGSNSTLRIQQSGAEGEEPVLSSLNIAEDALFAENSTLKAAQLTVGGSIMTEEGAQGARIMTESSEPVAAKDLQLGSNSSLSVEKTDSTTEAPAYGSLDIEGDATFASNSTLLAEDLQVGGSIVTEDDAQNVVIKTATEEPLSAASLDLGSNSSLSIEKTDSTAEAPVLGQLNITGDANLASNSTLTAEELTVGKTLQTEKNGTGAVIDADSTTAKDVLVSDDSSLELKGTLATKDGDVTLGKNANLTVEGLTIDGDLKTTEGSTGASVETKGTTILADNINLAKDSSLSLTGSFETSDDLILGENASFTYNGEGRSLINGDIVGDDSNALTLDNKAVLTVEGALAEGMDVAIKNASELICNTTELSSFGNLTLEGEGSSASFAGGLQVTDQLSITDGAHLKISNDANIDGTLVMGDKAQITATNVKVNNGIVTEKGAKDMLIVAETTNTNTLNMGNESELSIDGNFNATEGVTMGENSILNLIGKGESTISGALDGDSSSLVKVDKSSSLTLNGNFTSGTNITLDEGSLIVNNGSDITLNGTLAGDLDSSILVDEGSTLTVGGSIENAPDVAIKNGSTLNIDAKDMDVKLNKLELVESKLNIEEGSLVTTDQLLGDDMSTLKGHIIIDGTAAAPSTYEGFYDEKGATIELTGKSHADLATGEKLSIIGDKNTVVTLLNASGSALNKIDSTGTVNFGTITESITLGENSSLKGADVNVGINGNDLYTRIENAELDNNYLTLTTGGALDISDATLTIDFVTADGERLAISETEYTDFVIVDLSDNEDSDLTGLKVEFEDSYYNDYFSDIRIEGTKIIATVNTNTTPGGDSGYGDLGITKEGKTGLAMLDDTKQDLDPQGKGQYEDLGNILDELDDYVDDYQKTGNYDARVKGDRLAAAVLGVSVSALSSSLSADTDRQIDSIMNRASNMMPYADYSGKGGLYTEPNAQFWVTVEGGASHLGDGTYATGHDYTAIGGSVGADIYARPNFSYGIAFTSMWGDIAGHAIDRGEGELESKYLSFYGRYTKNNWIHTFAFSGGLVDASLSRTVSVEKQAYHTHGDTDGYGYAISYQASYDLENNDTRNLKLLPFGRVSLVSTCINGFNESGSDAALGFSEQETTYVSFAVGIEGEAVVAQRLFKHGALLDFRGMFKIDAGDMASSTDVRLLNMADKSYNLEGAERSAAGFEIGAGLVIPIRENKSAIFTDVSYEFRSDYNEVYGTVGYQYSF